MKMKKRVISAFLTALLCVSILSPYAFAAKSISDLKKEMEQRSSEIKKTEKQINSKKEERSEQVAARNKLDLQISAVMDDIEDTENIILEKQKEIDEKNDKIDELTQVIEENKEKMKTRLKIMYEYGSSSYLELILEAKGLSDFYTRISVVKDIVNHDKTLINQYVTAKNEVEEAKKVVEFEKQEQVDAKGILEGKKKELKTLQSQRDEVIKALNSDINTLEKQAKQTEDDYSSLKAELQKALDEEARKAAASKAGKNTPVYSGNGKFLWPSPVSSNVSSEFGYRTHPIYKTRMLHRGIDISAPAGSNVLAGEAGTVITAGWNNSYGYYVSINHGGGYVTLYAHNSKLLVSKGDTVTRGQVIAKVGSTGNSTGNHIHFEVMVNGVCQNPRSYV